MIFKAVTIPTPTRVKGYIKEHATKERVCIYSLIGLGGGIIGLSDFPAKKLVIGVLIYYGVAYEIIEKSEGIINDPIFIEIMMKNQYIGYGMPTKLF